MSAVAVRLQARREAHPLVALTVAAVTWVALYLGNVPFWGWALYTLAGLPQGSRWSDAIHFFVVDTTKILLLLVAIIFVVRILRSFLSIEHTRRILGGKREGAANVAAAGLGVATPFCSCSAVPAFIGFVAAGVPLGVTLSFLIASPLVNEVAIVLLYGLFGLEIVALYIGAGLVLAITAGFVLGRMRLERYVEPFVLQAAAAVPANGGPEYRPTWSERINLGVEEVKTIVGKIWPYLLSAPARLPPPPDLLGHLDQPKDDQEGPDIREMWLGDQSYDSDDGQNEPEDRDLPLRCRPRRIARHHPCLLNVERG
jgi:uncharacterized membrane protein YraQ (UPF0718 family)